MKLLETRIILVQKELLTMNNKGQALIIFVMILPVLLLGAACIVDSSYMMYQKNRLDNINYDVLSSVKNKINFSEEEIEDLILMNDSKIVNEDISIDKTNTVVSDICINNYIYVDSIFGKLIGFDEYKIKSEICVKVNNNS